jgi:hypothetical protein
MSSGSTDTFAQDQGDLDIADMYEKVDTGDTEEPHWEDTSFPDFDPSEPGSGLMPIGLFEYESEPVDEPMPAGGQEPVRRRVFRSAAYWQAKASEQPAGFGSSHQEQPAGAGSSHHEQPASSGSSHQEPPAGGSSSSDLQSTPKKLKKQIDELGSRGTTTIRDRWVSRFMSVRPSLKVIYPSHREVAQASSNLSCMLCGRFCYTYRKSKLCVWPHTILSSSLSRHSGSIGRKHWQSTQNALL